MPAADAIILPGLSLPAGHRLVSLATRPDLGDPMSDFNVVVWPEFMLNDPVMKEHWHHIEDDWPQSQLLLLDASDAIAATANTSPLAWDGTDDGLPAGVDGQMLAAVAGLAAGTPANSMGALQIIVDPTRRGTGLADLMHPMDGHSLCGHEGSGRLGGGLALGQRKSKEPIPKGFVGQS
jgi:hypothetical protein